MNMQKLSSEPVYNHTKMLKHDFFKNSYCNYFFAKKFNHLS